MLKSTGASHAQSPKDEIIAILSRLGIDPPGATGGLEARSPIDGRAIGSFNAIQAGEAREAIGRAHAAFRSWRRVPAPQRGEFVRLLGEELRGAKSDLGRLITLEVGKIPSEGLGEVQEMIDICDFAVGLSRQLYGLTMATERPDHRMMESWHPYGVCGVITAFNFPGAVWSWNAAIALVCGNSVVWKPSEKTLLTSLAIRRVFQAAAERFGGVPEGLMEVLAGGSSVGEILIDDPRVGVVSATGSTRMGKQVAAKLAARLARAILELGGNNAAIVAPSANLDLALRAIAFAAMGTAGQRCTTLRRLFVHDSVYDELVPKLVQVYASAPIGDPRAEGTLVGPLIDRAAFEAMARALDESRSAGGSVHGGGRHGQAGEAFYARPALVEMPEQTGPMLRETFAPILYVVRYRDFEEAIDLHNAVGAGLSSSIFTLNMREA